MEVVKYNLKPSKNVNIRRLKAVMHNCVIEIKIYTNIYFKLSADNIF